MAEHDPFDREAQEQAEAEAKERAKLAQRIEKEDLIWLMSGKRGRRIARSFLERAGVFRSSFNTNAMQMAFNEGTRNEGLALTAKLITYCPAQYAEMITENKDDN